MAAEVVATERYYDANFDWIPAGVLRSSARVVYPACNRVLGVMEGIGGFFANLLGLNESRFQYAVDEMRRRERAKAEREAAEFRRERQRALEHDLVGLDDDSADTSGVPYAPALVLEKESLAPERETME